MGLGGSMTTNERSSVDHAIRSAVAGGFAGGVVCTNRHGFSGIVTLTTSFHSCSWVCWIFAGACSATQAKTAVAPLDRLKILYQTHHHEFKQFPGEYVSMIAAEDGLLKNWIMRNVKLRELEGRYSSVEIHRSDAGVSRPLPRALVDSR